MTGKAPNILVVQADQMTALALSLYGHTQVKTPHLERLAGNGTVFENAYCNFPLCVPSRMSMLAGRYANAISMWDNAIEMPASVPTLAHYLRDRDYHTVLCGKMHFIGPDQVHGFNERITTDIYPANFAWTPDWIVGERYRPTGINLRAVVDAGFACAACRSITTRKWSSPAYRSCTTWLDSTRTNPSCCGSPSPTPIRRSSPPGAIGTATTTTPSTCLRFPPSRSSRWTS